MTRATLAALASLLLLAACNLPYRPGVDGSRASIPSNLPSNAEPEPASSRPR